MSKSNETIIWWTDKNIAMYNQKKVMKKAIEQKMSWIMELRLLPSEWAALNNVRHSIWNIRKWNMTWARPDTANIFRSHLKTRINFDPDLILAKEKTDYLMAIWWN